MRTPQLDTRAICISNNPTLTAVTSSYFDEPDTYFVVFRFPEVNAPYNDESQQGNDDFISNLMGNEAAVQINNAVARLRPEKIILAGLTELQKTFCRFVPQHRRIDINTLEEVEARLGFIEPRFSGELLCRKEDLIPALLEAKRRKNKLVISTSASKLVSELNHTEQNGIVVIEDDQDILSLIAANYAFSINAVAVFVKPIARSELHDIQRAIYLWKEQGSDEDWAKLENKIRDRIGHIDFSPFKFATFFTEGLPYSLYLRNTLPISYVNRSLRQDLFIFNSIIYESLNQFEAVVVFSPEEFEDEETTHIINQLEEKKVLVKALLHKDATVRNFGDYTQHYPYDLLHICSHGGETNGYYVVERFTDRQGNEHTIEYEEVIGFSPLPGGKLVQVDRKVIFRRFDGLAWMSHELKAQNLPLYVFEDMRKALFDGKLGKNAASRREREEPIVGSCHVKCYDSIHQGMFWALASHSSPVIFNNTCSSWNEISHFFIAGGSRGYIGTLWSIENAVAKSSAEGFYKNLWEGTILEATFEMNKAIGSSRNADIYIYWGVHFSTIRKPTGEGRVKVLRELLRAFFRWVEKTASTKVDEVKKNSVYILQFVYSELVNNFGKDELVELEKEIQRNRELRRNLSRRDEPVKSIERGVLHLPSETKPRGYDDV